jgi:hypothetical protein
MIFKFFCTKGCVSIGMGGGGGCHFRAQKILDFQGPLIPIALKMDLPASKSLRPTSL